VTRHGTEKLASGSVCGSRRRSTNAQNQEADGERAMGVVGEGMVLARL